MRERTVRTSRGVMRLPLLQSTCGGCGKTRVPWAEALGLEPRRRISPELRRKAVEQVPGQSYHRSVRTLHECLGVRMSASTLHGYVQEVAERVELTPSPDAEVVIADGTKIRAGKRTMLEDLRLGFQWMGCSQRGKRRRTNLRLIAVDVGRGSWKTVLRGDARTTLVVTDAEAAVASHVRARYPKARHQYCEWHVGYTLGYSLREDGVSLQERRALQREMRRILWGKGSQEQKRALYDGFTERMACYPKTHTQLQRASPHILFPEPSQVRTTSVVERQMREVDRRAWIGVRWSVRGLRNLILLSLTRTHNPDDYERVWMN